MPGRALILVVEPDQRVQRLVKQELEREGYRVAQAFSSVELTRELSIAKPDLIVLDVQLPDADGRDRLASLKRDPKTAEIPVLVWSGTDLESERRIALSLGAEDYIEREEAPSRLVGKIERILFRVSEPKMRA